ncbi:hypothetical protein FZC66_04355 [Priestia megaterium]|nr:hypothetical protein FZC66_04355 [Priestia megaterium]
MVGFWFLIWVTEIAIGEFNVFKGLLVFNAYLLLEIAVFIMKKETADKEQGFIKKPSLTIRPKNTGVKEKK